ncbi:unnamed protein product [Polarella glacialis]|uniref:Uncharacterized protein n=1 Tax=Polarella glacialis TaxID=89957 RepID=A0A813FNL4_POLGL|nr:unnamed protein product [Polarella glacialis]
MRQRARLRQLKSQLAEARWDHSDSKGQLADCDQPEQAQRWRNQVEDAADRMKTLERQLKELRSVDDGLSLSDCAANTTAVWTAPSPASAKQEATAPATSKSSSSRSSQTENTSAGPESPKSEVRLAEVVEAKEPPKASAAASPPEEASGLRKGIVGHVHEASTDLELNDKGVAIFDGVEQKTDRMGEKLEDLRKFIKQASENEKKIAKMEEEMEALRDRATKAEIAYQELQAKLAEMKEQLVAAGLGDVAEAIFANLIMKKASRIRVFDRLYLDAIDRLHVGSDGPSPLLVRYLESSESDPEVLAATLERIRKPRLHWAATLEGLRHKPAPESPVAGHGGVFMISGPIGSSQTWGSPSPPGTACTGLAFGSGVSSPSGTAFGFRNSPLHGSQTSLLAPSSSPLAAHRLGSAVHCVRAETAALGGKPLRTPASWQGLPLFDSSDFALSSRPCTGAAAISSPQRAKGSCSGWHSSRRSPVAEQEKLGSLLGVSSYAPVKEQSQDQSKEALPKGGKGSAAKSLGAKSFSAPTLRPNTSAGVLPGLSSVSLLSPIAAAGSQRSHDSTSQMDEGNLLPSLDRSETSRRDRSHRRGQAASITESPLSPVTKSPVSLPVRGKAY